MTTVGGANIKYTQIQRAMHFSKTSLYRVFSIKRTRFLFQIPLCGSGVFFFGVCSLFESGVY